MTPVQEPSIRPIEGREPLDAIGSGDAGPFARLEVSFDLLFAHRSETHGGIRSRGPGFPRIPVDQGDSRPDEMRSSREKAHHPARVLEVGGLSQSHLGEALLGSRKTDERIGGQYQASLARRLEDRRARLIRGEGDDPGGRGKSVSGAFVDIRRKLIEGNTRFREQIAASRGIGG